MRSRAGTGPGFIGIGAQRTGTSWLYACMYEHPQVCMPRKEINFFSRERNWKRGYEWYERVFAECPADAVVGEFSTSYLTDAATPARIQERYPDVKLIVSVRHPVERAYSSYLNDIVAGSIAPATGFRDALRAHPEYLEAGRYSYYIGTYLDHFPREQLLVLVFDDARRDPAAAIGQVYDFLGVDPGFRPTMLDRRVGVGRVPRSRWIERRLLDASATLRRHSSTRPVWWLAKRLGLGDRVRALNTDPGSEGRNDLDPLERRALIRQSEDDIRALEVLLGRELPQWRQ